MTDQKLYSHQIEKVYQKIKNVSYTPSQVLSLQKFQACKLPQIKAFQEVEQSKLESSLKLSKNASGGYKNCNFGELVIQVSQFVSQVAQIDQIDFLVQKNVKKSTVLEILVQSQVLVQQQGKSQQENYTRLNQFLGNLPQERLKVCEQLEDSVQQLTYKITTEFEVCQLVQVIGNFPELLVACFLYLHTHQPQLMSAALNSYVLGAQRHVLKSPSDFKKKVAGLQNPIKKSIKQQVSLPINLTQNPTLTLTHQQVQVLEQLQHNYILNVEVLNYLTNLGYQIPPSIIPLILQTRQLSRMDLYNQLLTVKFLLLNTNSNDENATNSCQLVQDLCLQLLGKQYKSTELAQVTRWIQLISDIKFLIQKQNKDEAIVLQYLLSFVKQQIISWNFQDQIQQSNQADCEIPPILSSSKAKQFVDKWTFLAIKCLSQGTLNQKFVESFKEHLMKEQIWKKPWLFVHKSRALELYLRKQERDKFLCNMWLADDLILNLKSFTLRKKNDNLECQLMMKTLDLAKPKQILFVLPQLFQSLRMDKNTGYLITDFLIRKSMQYVTVAHNVLWFCKVESVSPSQQDQKKRRVPLPIAKEVLPQICLDLYEVILNKMPPQERVFFQTETNFFEKITSISGCLLPQMTKDEKKQKIKEKLIEYNQDIPECVYLPVNQNYKVAQIVTTSGQPMQSAARVPIMITFEVEDYPGPDKHIQMQRTDQLRSIFSLNVAFDETTSQSISEMLEHFSQYWMPVTCEEDINDDEVEFNICQETDGLQNEHNIITHSNVYNKMQNIACHTLNIKKSMFAVGGQKQSSPIRMKQHSLLKTHNEEREQRQFMKQIKDKAFGATDQRVTHSTISIMKPFVTTQSGQVQPNMNKSNMRFEKQKQPNEKNLRAVSCIFKVNDDLRQDILALQFIIQFKKIFKKHDMDLYVYPYSCISNRTGSENLLGGIIEVCPESSSRDMMGKAYEINLHQYFLKKYGSESTDEFKCARYNFIKSLAAYAVLSFILQIKDRHNGNILIDVYGHVIHIDFGFIYDITPGKDTKFESAAFKLTQEYIDILGGSIQAPAFKLFEQMVIQCYLAVREYADDFISLTELMLYSGFPCFKPQSVKNLEDRFRRDLNPMEAAAYMRSMIHGAANKWTTRFYDGFQYYTNKVHY